MKTCPVCGARAFDDAEVCYGCLHRYEATGAGSEGNAAGKEPPRSTERSETVAPPCAAAPAAPPVAASVVPPRASAPSGDAGWVVRFELPGYASSVDADGRDGFVVRFLPETLNGSDERRRTVVARGTHARDAPVPRAAMPERS